MALPAPTLATATTDYMPAGLRRYVLVPTIANPATPTSAELTAGTDYTNAITAVSGFSQSADKIDNSSFGSTFMTTIPGMISSDDSSWTLKASKVTGDARTTLTLNTAAFVAIFEEGITATGKLDIWPVRVSASNVDQVAKGDLATITVSFAIPNPPTLNIAVPTA